MNWANQWINAWKESGFDRECLLSANEMFTVMSGKTVGGLDPGRPRGSLRTAINAVFPVDFKVQFYKI